MRRILLLFPRLNNFVFFGVYEPLILEILSAIAKEEACAVELIDLRLERDGCERLARTGYVPDIIGLTTHGFPKCQSSTTSRVRAAGSGPTPRS